MGERADRPAQNRNELAPRLKLYERSSGLPVQVKDQDRFNPFISFIMYRFAGKYNSIPPPLLSWDPVCNHAVDGVPHSSGGAVGHRFGVLSPDFQDPLPAPPEGGEPFL